MNLQPALCILLLGMFQMPEEGTLLIGVSSAGHAVEGAMVVAAGKEVRTDSNGNARIAMAKGTWPVSVAGEGFQEATATVRIDAGAETRLELELIQAIVLEEQVVVTATRSDRLLEDEPVRIEVVDREDIEEKALMSPGSVAMLLSETTGLRVQTTSPAFGGANVRIQGLRGRYSQLLSDGLPLYGLQGDSLNLLQVPPLDLGQVEIIKGAASALYGPSALGGVINLVSQSPRNRQRELLLNVTTQEAADVTFWAVEPPRGNWAFTLLGGMNAQRRQDPDNDGWADLPQYVRGILRPRLFWDDGKGRSIFATLGVMAEDRRGGTIGDSDVAGGEEFLQALDTRRVDSGTVVRIPAGEGRLLTIKGSYSRRTERRRLGDVSERSTRTTWFGEAVLLGKTGPHTWLVGGAIQQDRYNAWDFPVFNYAFTTPGLIAQDEIVLRRVLTLGLSARVDHHNEYGTFASPRISLLYKPLPNWSARASVGTGFFAPTPFIEETEESGLSRLRPLRGLEAESARSGSFDTTWSRGPFEVVATVFTSRVRHPLVRRMEAPESFAIHNSEGPIRTWGTEFLTRYRLEGLLFLFTHGYTSSTEEDPDGAGRRDVPLTPRNVFSFNAIWEDERKGRVGIEAYYITRQRLDNDPYRSIGRGYFLFGLLLERRLGPVRLFINMENLGNIRQTRYAPLVRPVQAPDGRWTVDAWAPLDGRVINGGIRLAF